MIVDILTMAWKEKKEDIGKHKNWRDKIVNSVFPFLSLGILAVVPPLSLGPQWIKSPFSLLISVIVPIMVISMAIPFSIAGERERKTLETLLASRLPDHSILFGKMLYHVAQAVKITLFVHLLSLLTANLAHWEGKILFYSPAMTAVNLSLILLLSLFAASLGILMSLGADRVQQALQNLMVALMTPIMIPLVMIILIGKVFPGDLRARFEKWFEKAILSLDYLHVFQFVFIFLVVVDLVLLLMALSRFKRCRLHLD